MIRHMGLLSSLSLVSLFFGAISCEGDLGPPGGQVDDRPTTAEPRAPGMEPRTLFLQGGTLKAVYDPAADLVEAFTLDSVSDCQRSSLGATVSYVEQKPEARPREIIHTYDSLKASTLGLPGSLYEAITPGEISHLLGIDVSQMASSNGDIGASVLKVELEPGQTSMFFRKTLAVTKTIQLFGVAMQDLPAEARLGQLTVQDWIYVPLAAVGTTCPPGPPNDPSAPARTFLGQRR